MEDIFADIYIKGESESVRLQREYNKIEDAVFNAYMERDLDTDHFEEIREDLEYLKTLIKEVLKDEQRERT